MAPSVVNSIPSVESPTSPAGTLPVATARHSAVTDHPLDKIKVTCSVSAPSAVSTCVPSLRSTPPSTRIRSSSAAMLGSSRPSRRSPASMRMTRVPNLTKICASSQPTGPPPRMASELGRVLAASAWSEVQWYLCQARDGRQCGAGPGRDGL